MTPPPPLPAAPTSPKPKPATRPNSSGARGQITDLTAGRDTAHRRAEQAIHDLYAERDATTRLAAERDAAHNRAARAEKQVDRLLATPVADQHPTAPKATG